MKYVTYGANLKLSIEDAADREFIQDTLDNDRTDLQALDDLCDGHTGWLGNQGPAPMPTENKAPAVALGLEHDDNGVPRWNKRYHYSQADVFDWRNVLLAKGEVTLSFYDSRR